ncbi:MAG: hypothetical protein AAF696_39250 [Bacteroidota bacterium]
MALPSNKKSQLAQKNIMYQPYHIKLNRREDFKVHYKFYSAEEGGRTSLPHQGIRSDFWYEHDNHTAKGIFMIWPEFENRDGILIKEGQVLPEGIARMWIVSEELRPYHKERITIGTKGYFLEGKRTAECEVIDITGLE